MNNPVLNDGANGTIVYKIEGSVVFDPANNTLSSLQSDTVVTLYISASRCLLHLIENQGDILNQQTLMAVGWENHGLTVSPNAYYQNISNIRRSLDQVYSDKDIITTIKRSGLMISPDVVIEKVYLYAEEPSSEPPGLLLARQDENAITGSEIMITDEDIPSLQTSGPEEMVPRRSGFQFDSSMKAGAFLMALSIVLGGLISVAIYQNNKLYFFSNYTFLKSLTDGCKVYMNNDAGINRRDNPKINMVAPGCKGLNSAYLTEWDHHTRFSVFYCNDMNNDKGDRFTCISEYFGVDQ